MSALTGATIYAAATMALVTENDRLVDRFADSLTVRKARAARRGAGYTGRVDVICLECEKKFATASTYPTCPKCKGSDIEPR